MIVCVRVLTPIDATQTNSAIVLDQMGNILCGCVLTESLAKHFDGTCLTAYFEAERKGTDIALVKKVPDQNWW